MALRRLKSSSAVVLQKERISPGHQDVPNLSMAPQILQSLVKIDLGDGTFVGTHQPSPVQYRQ